MSSRIIARRAHPLACACGIDGYAEDPGDVYECGPCGRTWVSTDGFSRWRPESSHERRERLGLRWWQSLPPFTPTPDATTGDER